MCACVRAFECSKNQLLSVTVGLKHCYSFPSSRTLKEACPQLDVRKELTQL